MMNVQCKSSIVSSIALMLIGVNLIPASYSVRAETLSATCEEPLEDLYSAKLNLAREIAQIEVEKVLLNVTFHQDDPKLQALDQELLGLTRCLTALSSEDVSNLLATETISAAEYKLAELESQYANNQVIFANAYVAQQVLSAEIQALRQYLGILSYPKEAEPKL